MAVESARHYTGRGLGEDVWHCPACGAENVGPIAQGCSCGAGKPGRRATPSVDPPVTPGEDGPAFVSPAPRSPDTPDLATAWVIDHPEASLEDAFTAGYAAGILAARRAQREAVRPPPAPAPAGDLLDLDPKHKTTRTLIAALTLFRDQVLPNAQHEVMTGEWMAIGEVTQFITVLQHQLEAARV